MYYAAVLVSVGWHTRSCEGQPGGTPPSPPPQQALSSNVPQAASGQVCLQDIRFGHNVIIWQHAERFSGESSRSRAVILLQHSYDHIFKFKIWNTRHVFFVFGVGSRWRGLFAVYSASMRARVNAGHEKCEKRDSSYVPGSWYVLHHTESTSPSITLLQSAEREKIETTSTHSYQILQRRVSIRIAWPSRGICPKLEIGCRSCMSV